MTTNNNLNTTPTATPTPAPGPTRKPRKRIFEGFPNRIPCGVCRRIVDIVHSPRDVWTPQRREDLGTIAELLETTCSSHDPVLRPWVEAALSVAEDPAGPDDVVLVRRPRTTIDLVLELRPADGASTRRDSHSRHWALAKKKADLHPGSGLIINPQWVHLHRVRRWYARCAEQHKCCDDAEPWKGQVLGAPCWLIDVEASCLVRGVSGARYVTLSYVWGSREVAGDFLQTTRQHLATLQGKGVLAAGDLFDRVSPTVRDAMQLTRLMGIPYFWADALCIVQDDPLEIKQQYLDAMGSIYANAAFTIKATDGLDARHGLHGIRELQFPKPRECSQITVPFGGRQRFIQASPHDPWRREQARGRDSAYTYHERAWIYQESILSRRSLSFMDGKVYWQCQRGWWTEEQRDHGRRFGGGEPAQNILHRMQNFIRDPVLDMDLFGGVVLTYNHRKITSESDRFAAFAGLATILSRAFGPLIGGLPASFFDVMLLWQPGGRAPSRREQASSCAAAARSTWLPSWSWAGWNTHLDFGPWTTAGGTQRPMSDKDAWHEVIPTTEWSVSHRLDGQERRSIGAAWHAAKQQGGAASESFVSADWERHENVDRLPPDERASLHPGWDHPHVFTRKGMRQKQKPSGSNHVCPVPLPPPLRSSPPECPPYLHGRVERAWLPCETKCVSVPDATAFSGTSRTMGCHLCDDGGNRVGWLRMPLKMRLDQGEGAGAAMHRDGCRIELIAISRDLVQETEGSLRGDRRVTTPAGPMQDSYNVMWIGWRDGVAHRRALGKVRRQAWEALRRDVIDVTLE